MKVLIAPNALKGSLTAEQAAQAIQEGLRSANPDIETHLLPVGDGGDGSGGLLARALDAEAVTVKAHGPLGQLINTQFYFVSASKIAIVESASIIGLSLLTAEQSNPMVTSSYGLGQLISAALDYGAEKLIIGIGGSATNDAGMGMASALGVRFFNTHGNILKPMGKTLLDLQKWDTQNLEPRLKNVQIEVMCDVDNPLYGPNGAAFVFAAQKGANPEEVSILDHGLQNFARLVEDSEGLQIQHVKGAGAAGGLGAGLMIFCHAQLRTGIDVMLDYLQFDEKLRACDLVISAEGCLDSQSSHGKAPAGVARRARKFGIPSMVIAGVIKVSSQDLMQMGISKACSICDQGITPEKSMQQPYEFLADSADRCIRAWLVSSQ